MKIIVHNINGTWARFPGTLDIWVDDPEMLAIITYVGADPAVVLREGSDI